MRLEITESAKKDLADMNRKTTGALRPPWIGL